MSGNAVSAIYETGYGSITPRGRAALQPGGTGQQIVVTELPYGVTKGGDGGLTVQIVDGIRQGALAAIVDLYDDSTDEHATRLVLVLATNADAGAVIDALYEHTDLQISVEVRLTSLVKGQPRALNLRDLIAEWVSSRLAHQVRAVSSRATARCIRAARRPAKNDRRINRRS